MKKNTLIFVVGILMIIFGGISTLISVLAFNVASATVSYLVALGVAINEGLYQVALILSVLTAIATLVAGIMGTMYAAKFDKAKNLFMMGVILVALQLLVTVILVAAGGGFNPVTTLIGLVLPVLYVIGSKKHQA